MRDDVYIGDPLVSYTVCNAIELAPILAGIDAGKLDDYSLWAGSRAVC